MIAKDEVIPSFCFKQLAFAKEVRVTAVLSMLSGKNLSVFQERLSKS